ncbi:MAG: ribosome maturation factor RimM [Micromonosporaceae bacterium]|nr:ribosome maturation factor RimM [Micromonosporaceae bacterium]
MVIRPHGLRGEVLVDVRTDEPAERFAAGSVLSTDPADAGPLTIESARAHISAGKDRLIVVFADVLDRDAADALRGVALQVDSADVAATDDPDEFHDHQLVGLRAVDETGEPLGDVVRVDHAPANDLLVLRRPDGGQALVPFVRAIVPTVDLAAGRVVLTPPAGLLEL